MFRQRLINYALLMRLNRPIGILLLLWPTLWALWLASRLLRWLPWCWRRFVVGPLLVTPKSFRRLQGEKEPQEPPPARA